MSKQWINLSVSIELFNVVTNKRLPNESHSPNKELFSDISNHCETETMIEYE